MEDRTHQPVADLRGLSQLTIAGISGIVDVVEAMHQTLASVPASAFGSSAAAREQTSGVTGLVYRRVRDVVGIVGASLDMVLAGLDPLIGARSTWPGRDAVEAAINGIVGDYLAASGNSLAIPTQLRRHGRELSPTRIASEAIPRDGQIAVFIHGLCMSDLQWQRQGHDHGEALLRDLGFYPVYAHYNSGRHISTNGAELAQALESLIAAWPVPVSRLAIVGHSMGGLVARSACHVGETLGHTWRTKLDSLCFLGTPHEGAPLEQGGNWLDALLSGNPYTAPLARLGKVRSCGITDLRFAYLVDEDWIEQDRFERNPVPRTPVPLPQGVNCLAIAGSTGKRAGDFADRTLGDGIVPLSSALGEDRDERYRLDLLPEARFVAYETNHLDLLCAARVYERMRDWLEQEPIQAKD